MSENYYNSSWYVAQNYLDNLYDTANKLLVNERRLMPNIKITNQPKKVNKRWQHLKKKLDEGLAFLIKICYNLLTNKRRRLNDT